MTNRQKNVCPFTRKRGVDKVPGLSVKVEVVVKDAVVVTELDVALVVEVVLVSTTCAAKQLRNAYSNPK